MSAWELRVMRLITAGAVMVAIVAVSECRRNHEGQKASPPLASTPTPTPKPTPIYIPQKRMETARLFNEIQVRSTLESEPGGTATQERETPGSYALELNIKVKVPAPNQDMAALCKLNAALPQVLPSLPQLLPGAKVSPGYEALYRRKLNGIQRNLVRLDQLISRHNFFDCETILELQHPQTKRRALLVQADMDVDTDGADSDRLPAVDGNSATFQPMTSYRWPKRTINPNPFLPRYQTKLNALERELALAKGTGAARIEALKEGVGAARYEVNELKKKSFLLAATDPFVVLPGALHTAEASPYSVKVGDYCAIIYGETLYPAIVGDVGPGEKAGEASLRIARELSTKASAENRAENKLKVTYLFFPNSADKPFGPPDLGKWYARVAELLTEFGGYGGNLHWWEELSRPAPTPTPPPTPTPSPSPTAIPSPVPWRTTPLPSSSSTPVPSPWESQFLPPLPTAATASPKATPSPAAKPPTLD